MAKTGGYQSSPTPLRLPTRKGQQRVWTSERVHIRRGELAGLLRKIKYLLPLGRLTEAEWTLTSFIIAKRHGDSEFEGFTTWRDVPLGLSCGIELRILNALEQLGIETLGDLRAWSDAKLREQDRFYRGSIPAVRRAAADLREEFEAWQARQRRKPEGEGER